MKHFLKNHQVLAITTDSREYKMHHRMTMGGCPICAPHKGCNQWKSKRQRNWKKFRKHQWKEQPQKDSCNELWVDDTTQSDNHMSHEKLQKGVSTPQEAHKVQKAA